jgi:heme-degrading monooxygenase HmoA
MMLLERSYLLIREGLEADFAAAMAATGLPLHKAVPGATNVSLGRGLESPEKFMLLIEWRSMDVHIAFTKTTRFQEFLALLKPFTNGGSMEHFEMG